MGHDAPHLLALFENSYSKYMNIQIVGTVEYIDIGNGTWAVITDTDEQYEIWQPAPEAILQEGLKVKVNAKFRDDVFTTAAIGDVLEIEDFQRLG
jgi:hypothetical protein